ncbi:MAG: hypothetical protein DMG98_20265 [Acidobacteria bacterium]|nr:MAG: hypothetical protein DMG98_20265 [Acidobacteriota bacterium]
MIITPHLALFAYLFAAPDSPTIFTRKRFRQFFAPELRGPLRRVFRLVEEQKQEGQKIERHLSHISVWDSHNSAPQSEHCVLAVLEQE